MVNIDSSSCAFGFDTTSTTILGFPASSSLAVQIFWLILIDHIILSLLLLVLKLLMRSPVYILILLPLLVSGL